MTQIAVKRNILNSYSSTAVAVSGGKLVVTGATTVPTNQIQSAQWKSSSAGFGQRQTLTVSSFAAGKTYTFQITQKRGNYFLSAMVSHVATNTTASTQYGLILAQLIANAASAGIVFGATPTSSGSGVVIQGTPEYPFIQVKSITTGAEAITATYTAVVLPPAGSTITDAAPRVLTAGSAHGLTIGGLYILKISGVTGTGAADCNRNLYFVPTTTTAGILLGTSNTGAVTSTPAVIEVQPMEKDDLVDVFGEDGFVSKKVSGFDKSKSYLVLSVQYVESNVSDIAPNPVSLCNETGFDLADSDANAVVLAAASDLANFGLKSSAS